MSSPIITNDERAAALAERPPVSARELQLMETVGEYRQRVESLTAELRSLRGDTLIPWAVMSPEQQRITLHAMHRFGGSFVSRLATVWQLADPINSIKLGATFAGYVAEYGPGTVVYAEAERREAA